MRESVSVSQGPSQSLVIWIGGGLLLLIFAYWGGLENLFERWNKQEEYSHGYFIPLVTGWMLWQRREALLDGFGAPSWLGVAAILISAVSLLVGEVTALYLLIQLGFLLALLGFVLVLGGWRLIRVTAIPLAFLLFMIPLPYFIDSQLSWRLQLLSSEFGVYMLRLVDIAVYLEGNVIDLGDYKLQVVEACSGLRYLYPFLSLGFLAAYIFRAPIWQRAVVFLATIPITVFMNSLRIALVGILVRENGSEAAEGFLHYFEGWLIFIACLLILAGIIWLFDRLNGSKAFMESVGVPEIQPDGRGRRPVATLPLFASMAIIVLAGIGGTLVSERQEAVPEHAHLTTFPLQVDDWTARERALDEQVEQVLKVDEYLLADYRRPPGEFVNFYIAYYESQRKGASPHSPRVCIPGGGWLITDLQRVEVPVEGLQAPVPVNRVVVERRDRRQLVYYWFEQRGRRITNEYWMKWYLFRDSILRNRTDGALVRLTTPIHGEDGDAAADRLLREFMTRVMPLVPQYVPQ